MIRIGGSVQTRIIRRSEEQPDGCWFWTGATTKSGYGRLTVDSKYWRAHRAAYVAFKGAIPEGQVVRHLCPYRTCVNPDHLTIGSQRANVWDSIESGCHAVGGDYMDARPRPQEVEA